jgi:hypothetical protein
MLMMRRWKPETTFHALWLAAFFGGCAESDARATESALREYPIVFPPMHSAFGGSHDYSVTPFIAPLFGNEKYSEVDLSTIEWILDERFVKREDFSPFSHAAKLITKRSGVTTVVLTATNLNGTRLRAESTLTIHEAEDDTWDKGEARYSGGPVVAPGITSVDRSPPVTCGRPIDLRSGLVEDAACISCHSFDAHFLRYVPTPTQLARYSDEELSALAADGETPEGYRFFSGALRDLPDPECGYAIYHKRAIDADTQRGLVLKLRSLEPLAYRQLDLFMFGDLSEGERLDQLQKAEKLWSVPQPL